ncbi:DinB superfamily protein [Chitinophaga eiseniae]|uniref:DinB superfamily protein n=1 Tax=Chitinophaga eiseniae TaxID=634771 RepID=A0A1T4THM6_9BACT|nr:DinB family protein [Chitinophaga eiseniae]SKA39808.1 DinB superfamily protein [Chitinophaga eiseniae]
MKKVLLSLAVVLFSGFILPPPHPVKHEDKTLLIQQLKDSKDQLLKDVAGLTDAQLEFKPAPDRWSIIDCVEHLTIIEQLMMDAEKKLVTQPANPQRKKDLKFTDEKLLQMIEDRSQKQQTPPFGMPKHNYAAPADAINAFVAQRNQLIDYVTNTNDQLREHITDDPNLGTVDAYQLLLFNAAHTRRHIRQIDEVKADPGFPK